MTNAPSRRITRNKIILISRPRVILSYHHTLRWLGGRLTLADVRHYFWSLYCEHGDNHLVYVFKIDDIGDQLPRYVIDYIARSGVKVKWRDGAWYFTVTLAQMQASNRLAAHFRAIAQDYGVESYLH